MELVELKKKRFSLVVLRLLVIIGGLSMMLMKLIL